MTPSRYQITSFVQLSNEGAAELILPAVYACMSRCGILAGEVLEPVEDPQACSDTVVLEWLRSVPPMDRFEDPDPPPANASPQFISHYEAKRVAYEISRQRYEKVYELVADLAASLETKLGLRA